MSISRHSIQILSQPCNGDIYGSKKGNLASLAGRRAIRDVVAVILLHQMLQALDYLAFRGIIHRDTKPENILYILQPDGQYLFQLGDFGFCNNVNNNARSRVGTLTYTAPEISDKMKNQTHKVDVWSLFVTMLWALDARGIRHMSNFKSPGRIKQAVLFAAEDEPRVSHIREMAIINPVERASAAQMLAKCYHGEGHRTPLDLIPALTSSYPFTADAANQTQG